MREVGGDWKNYGGGGQEANNLSNLTPLPLSKNIYKKDK